jgi:hypothetical protein
MVCGISSLEFAGFLSLEVLLQEQIGAGELDDGRERFVGEVLALGHGGDGDGRLLAREDDDRVGQPLAPTGGEEGIRTKQNKNKEKEKDNATSRGGRAGGAGSDRERDEAESIRRQAKGAA